MNLDVNEDYFLIVLNIMLKKYFVLFIFFFFSM